MARKSAARKSSSALVSTLVRAEHAAEEEILETPAVSALSRDVAAGAASEDEEEGEEEDEEAEIERRLVEEKLAEEQLAANERENRGIYNGEALKNVVADYAASTKALGWVELLDVCAQPLELVNVHDDLKREVAFYNNSLASVRLAKDKLKQLGAAYKRPLDYFAEMLKSDAHMAKVKDKLIYEQKKIHAVEERKKSQAHRKVAKELQAEKAKERLQQKKDTLAAVKEWKKRRNADKGGAIHDDDDRELEDIVAGKTTVAPTGGKRKRAGGADDRDAKKPRNAKREAKNKKFGFGGPKKFAKSNTRESTNDMSAFPGRKMRGGAAVASKGRAAGGKAPKAKRPSKAARTNKRSGGKR